MYDENLFNNLTDMKVELQECYQELDKIKRLRDIMPQDIEFVQNKIGNLIQQSREAYKDCVGMSSLVSKYAKYKEKKLSPQRIAKVRQCMLGTYHATKLILDKYEDVLEDINKRYTDPYDVVDRPYYQTDFHSISVVEAKDKLNLLMSNYKDSIQFVLDYMEKDDKTAYPINHTDINDWLYEIKKKTFIFCEEFENNLKMVDIFDNRELLADFDYTLRETEMNILHVAGLTDEADEWELTFGE